MYNSNDMFKKVRYITVPMESVKYADIPGIEPEVPAGIWIKCPKCDKAVINEDYEDAGKVCHLCGHHARLSAEERISLTVDKGSFVETDASVTTSNSLDFEGYTEKTEKLKEQLQIKEAVITGLATIENSPVLIGAMDTNFMMASMGAAVGEKLTRLFEYAIEKKLPVVIFIASGGARMQEGIYSLMQMAKVSGVIGRFGSKGGFYTAVLTDPTTGGVTASFAMLGDIIIAEPGAMIGFAGRRVIEGTIKQKIPENFQTAEFNLEHGFIDAIVHRHDMKKELGRLLKLHAGGKNPC